MNSPARRSFRNLTGWWIATAVIAVTAVSVFSVNAADHADSPATSEGNLDINDLYVFENGDDMVFAMTVSPLLTPGSATADARFNTQGLYEFKLDRERDGIEDAVIQVGFLGQGPGQRVNVRGPMTVNGGSQGRFVPSNGSIRGAFNTEFSENGITVFAGPRDDPFFIDLFGDRSVTSVLNAAFGAALGEQIGADGEQTLAFNPDATDDLAGLNTLAIVVQVPKGRVAEALGISTSDAFFAWATTSLRP
jgi:hypothetical protein